MAKTKSGALTGDQDRMEVVFTATAELERIFLGLRSQVTAVDTDDQEANAIDPAILGCVARRGLTLTRAIPRTFDDSEETADLERLVSE